MIVMYLKVCHTVENCELYLKKNHKLDKSHVNNNLPKEKQQFCGIIGSADNIN